MSITKLNMEYNAIVYSHKNQMTFRQRILLSANRAIRNNQQKFWG